MDDVISVIMSTYNEKEEWVRKSVESILRQTYTQLEFIIILDDPENVALKELLIGYSEADSRVTMIINEENLGLVKSLNRALQHCTGVYIARMDADDISHENRLQLQKDYLEKEQLDFVFSSVTMIDEEGKEMSQTCRRDLTPHQVRKKLGMVNMSFHPTWLVKKQVYDQLGGYRDIAHCEDYDFSLRAIGSGYRIGKLNESLLSCRFRETSVSRSYSLEQFLTSRRLIDLYQKGRLDQALMFNSRALQRVTEKDKEKFKQAEVTYTNGIRSLKNNQKVKGMGWIAASSFKSKYYLLKNLYYLYYKSKDL